MRNATVTISEAPTLIMAIAAPRHPLGSGMLLLMDDMDLSIFVFWLDGSVA
jgi:hypothetical protein